ncbi:MAG: hydrolase [Clostridia bacterium]
MEDFNYTVTNDFTNEYQSDLDLEILFENESGVYQPVVCDEICLEYSRRNSPGSLSFSCITDGQYEIFEGNVVSLKCGGENLFLGYVFKRTETSPSKISVLCYDQLRYLKNKSYLSYTNKKFSDVLKTIASSYRLNLGTVEDTSHVIAQRIEEATLFDILGNAQDETESKTGKQFVLYDNYGKLSLQEISSLFVPIMIDETSASSYSYVTSIDKDVYTRVTVAQNNSYTGQRDLFVSDDVTQQDSWGVLEYWQTNETLTSSELKELSKSLLEQYSQKKKTLSLNNCIGDTRVIGGSSLVVGIKLNDEILNEIMIVEKVKHKFLSGSHTMDLDLSSVRGDFSI